MDSGQSASFKPVEFIRAMDLAYAAADLVISRAGALTLGEGDTSTTVMATAAFLFSPWSWGLV